MARSTPPPMLNDGWTDVAYDFGMDAEQNARVSGILNEACHAFRHHAEGGWSTPDKANDKDAYATLLAAEIELRPGMVKRLLDTGDRVVRMLTYRAVEIVKSRQSQGYAASSVTVTMLRLLASSSCRDRRRTP